MRGKNNYNSRLHKWQSNRQNKTIHVICFYTDTQQNSKKSLQLQSAKNVEIYLSKTCIFMYIYTLSMNSLVDDHDRKVV